MAHKYNTFLVEKSEFSKVRSDKEPLPQPWYKERLKTKFLRKNHNSLSDALNGHRWRFLKNGLDDFRDGYPPQSEEDLAIIHSEKGAGLSPFLKDVAESFKPAQNVSKRLTKSQMCFSKSLPLQQTRREQMEEIEYGLSQHPLALYPHLEEGIPPEGGENNNIEESMIMSLFASDYEMNTALNIPIQVMQLTNIPRELRMIVGIPPPRPSVKTRKTTDLESTHSNGYKYMYGAWYLDPKTWTKRRADEPLLDPESVAQQNKSRLPEGAEEKDEEIKRLHATTSFLKYTKAKGHRRPEFLGKQFATVGDEVEK
ncbi:protein FAM47E isoform X2 [Cetorhinus maximus]